MRAIKEFIYEIKVDEDFLNNVLLPATYNTPPIKEHNINELRKQLFQKIESDLNKQIDLYVSDFRKRIKNMKLYRAEIF